MKLSDDEIAEVLAKYDKAQIVTRLILEKYLRAVDHPLVDAMKQFEDFEQELKVSHDRL